MAVLSGSKSQTEVAAIMGVSRVTVVKYLQTARENGLVHINLDVNVFGSIELLCKFAINSISRE